MFRVPHPQPFLAEGPSCHSLVLPLDPLKGPAALPPSGWLTVSSVPSMHTWVPLPEADRAEVSRFAKNFLPILFNLYGQPVAAGEAAAPRRAVLETIRTYLTITESQVSAVEGGDAAVVAGWVGLLNPGDCAAVVTVSLPTGRCQLVNSFLEKATEKVLDPASSDFTR